MPDLGYEPELYYDDLLNYSQGKKSIYTSVWRLFPGDFYQIENFFKGVRLGKVIMYSGSLWHHRWTQSLYWASSSKSRKEKEVDQRKDCALGKLQLRMLKDKKEYKKYVT